MESIRISSEVLNYLVRNFHNLNEFVVESEKVLVGSNVTNYYTNIYNFYIKTQDKRITQIMQIQELTLLNKDWTLYLNKEKLVTLPKEMKAKIKSIFMGCGLGYIINNIFQDIEADEEIQKEIKQKENILLFRTKVESFPNLLDKNIREAKWQRSGSYDGRLNHLIKIIEDLRKIVLETPKIIGLERTLLSLKARL